MQPGIRAGTVASPTHQVRALPNSTGRKEYLRANRVARAFSSPLQLQRNPMVPILHDIAQHRGWGVHVVQDDVHVAVIEKITESGAARGNYVCQAAASCRRNFLELCSIQIPKELRTFGPRRAPVAMIHRRVDVSVCDENV